ncbi:polysaccharide deacetylase family protein [Actinospica sp.]|jgi:peptidoglycan/xylan/chitin deacetylase (PgdA/CDA1 family)|uniref:polysaccharide deacetylase family protein n=1 Tax=Actinospica sp. TaxID=1872142 RepID=UPI002D125F23|nr:polysaccharide deacetylase family protein [Actinospica sp.]HWG26547.1 polysaccharide deacetylase family protein [Actinospica sp.]
MTDIEPAQWTRRGFGRFLGGAAGLATLGSFAAACTGSGNGTANAGDLAASGSAVAAGDASASPTASSSGADGSGVDADLLMQRYGLKPFTAPATPATKAIALDPQNPTIFAKVPTSEKICFVTVDDGIDKDPAFIQMVKDVQVPITISLADTLIRDDYAYFEKLHETGFVSIQNHTVNHPLSMPSMGYQEQFDEIAGQQTKLHKEYGVTPYIFRPPGGNYDSVTREACRAAGLKGMMLWKEAMEIQDMEYQTSDRHLQPGDVILCHFRGPAQLKGETMVKMMTRLYSHIQAQGFTVADVTRYV